MAISHGTFEGIPDAVAQGSERVYARTSNPRHLRSRADIERFFEGLDLVAPGVVYLPLWRPEGPDDLLLAEPARTAVFGGVGRMP